jgi:hypothetical protein
MILGTLRYAIFPHIIFLASFHYRHSIPEKARRFRLLKGRFFSIRWQRNR